MLLNLVSWQKVMPWLLVQGGRAVDVLLGDQQRLQDAQHPDREPHGERSPDQDVNPPRRLEAELDPEHEHHDDGAQPHDDEDGGAVAGIVAAQVEVAHGAAIDDGEQAAEQPAAAATRASPAQRDVDRRLPWPLGHHVLPKSNRRGTPGGIICSFSPSSGSSPPLGQGYRICQFPSSRPERPSTSLGVNSTRTADTLSPPYTAHRGHNF